MLSVIGSWSRCGLRSEFATVIDATFALWLDSEGLSDYTQCFQEFVTDRLRVFCQVSGVIRLGQKFVVVLAARVQKGSSHYHPEDHMYPAWRWTAEAVAGFSSPRR